MVNTAALKDRIQKSGYRYAFVAEQLGISRQSLTYKINNRVDFKSEEIMKLCDLIGITRLSDKDAIFFVKKID